MTCHEARDLFSAVVDDALAARERAEVDAHLTGCADCRRELDRFRQTVTLVQALPAERAPADFVDRVVTRAELASRARPASAAPRASWPSRLARGLFVPWTTKLPLEAAALLVVAGLAIWIFQRMPEQRQSARLTPELPRVETPARIETPPRVETPAPAEAPPSGERSAPSENAPTATAVTPALPDNAPNEKKETQQGLADARARASEMSPPRAEQESREGARAESPPAAGAVARALRVPGSPDVFGRLTVDNPSGGVTALTEMVGRFGGRVGASRYDGDAHLVEFTIPRDRYPDFAREVAGLGRWQAEADAASLPETVRVRIRLTR